MLGRVKLGNLLFFFMITVLLLLFLLLFYVNFLFFFVNFFKFLLDFCLCFGNFFSHIFLASVFPAFGYVGKSKIG